MINEIETYVDKHRDEIISTWEKLVNLEGTAREKECMDKVANYLYDEFSKTGMSCKLIEKSSKSPMVLVGTIGQERKGKPVVFCGHYDTVFKKGMFGENPFKIEDGKAYGPGVLDMKGGIVISLYVIKALESIGYNERPIKIVYCGDEEIGHPESDAARIINEVSRGAVCGFNMETSPVNNSVCIGRKGAMVGKVIVNGVSAHSGNNFEAGRNAVVEAAHKIIAIDSLTDMESGTHINCGIVQGGKAWNIIPDECTIEFSGRFSKNSEIERVNNAITKFCSESVIEGTSSVYKPSTPLGVFEKNERNMALYKFCNQISKEYNYGELGHVFLGGGSDAVEISRENVPTNCSFGVLGEWNHTEREYAVVESMFTRSKLISAIILNLNKFNCM